METAFWVLLGLVLYGAGLPVVPYLNRRCGWITARADKPGEVREAASLLATVTVFWPVVLPVTVFVWGVVRAGRLLRRYVPPDNSHPSF